MRKLNCLFTKRTDRQLQYNMNSASLIDLENNDKLFVCLKELRLRCLKKCTTHFMYYYSTCFPYSVQQMHFPLLNTSSWIDAKTFFHFLMKECDSFFFTFQIYEIIKSKLDTSNIIYRLLTDRQTNYPYCDFSSFK